MGQENTPPEDQEVVLKRRKLELEVVAAERENELRARKLAAEAELAEQELPDRRKKLTADLLISQRQASSQWLLLEWLKAATVPVALLGLMATSIVSISQLNLAREQAEQGRAQFAEQLGVARQQAATAATQAEHARQQFAEQVRTQERERRLERLDKAVAKLTGDSIGDRVAAVTALNLLLSGTARDVDRPALIALIDRLALEVDPVVQDVIISAFERKILKGLEISALDAALATAAERSRLLVKLVRDRPGQSYADRRRRLVETFANKNSDDVLTFMKPITQFFPIPKYHEDDLKVPQIRYRPPDLLQNQGGEAVTSQLFNLSRVIEALFSVGARHQEMSSIYCAGCAFVGSKEGPRPASATNFQGAILDRATFSDLDLSGSVFEGAQILGVSFARVNLVDANLGSPRDSGLILGIAETALYLERVANLPISFACSNLSGAKVDGIPVVVVATEILREGLGVAIAAPDLRGVRLDGKLSKLRIEYSWLNSREIPQTWKSLPVAKPQDIHEWVGVGKEPIERHIMSLLKRQRYAGGLGLYADIHEDGAKSYFNLAFSGAPTSWDYIPTRLRAMIEKELRVAGMELGRDGFVTRSQDIPFDLNSCETDRSVTMNSRMMYGRIPWRAEEVSVP